ncbi:MAG TPA: hypothetical protein VF950_12080 [Planctomycetota bacterium]
MRALAVAATLLLVGIALTGPQAWRFWTSRYEAWRIDRNPDARCRIAEVHLQRGEYTKALEISRAVLRRHPTHATAEELIVEAVSLLKPRLLEEIMHSNSLIVAPSGPPREGGR